MATKQHARRSTVPATPAKISIFVSAGSDEAVLTGAGVGVVVFLVAALVLLEKRCVGEFGGGIEVLFVGVFGDRDV